MALANTSQAIGAVTRLIDDHLGRRTSLAVEVGRPEDAANAQSPTLNLFLYETSFDPCLRNQSLVEGQPPPLWLVLKYLLTGFDGSGSSDSAEAHDVLGRGLSALQELAYLGLDASAAPAVRGALEDNPETLKLTFDECSVDLVNKITQASDDEYRLSVAFQVRPVMIVPPERPSFSLLVGVDYSTSPTTLSPDPVGLDVLPSLGPRLRSLSPAKFAIGDEFEITGEDLHVSNLECFLGPAELGIVGQWPDRLRARVETALQSGRTLSAGEHPLLVRQRLPDSGRYRSSNILIGRLLPTVTSAATGVVTANAANFITTTITVNGFLLGRNEDAILLALYRDGAVTHQFEVVKPLPGPGDPPDNQQQLTLAITASPVSGVPVGDYLLLVIVNGQQARTSPMLSLRP